MRVYVLRRTQNKFKEDYLEQQKRIKIFRVWQRVLEINPREKAAQKLLQYSRLQKCFTSLKNYALKSLKVKIFKLKWNTKRILVQAFESLQRNVVIKQYHALVYQKLKTRRELALKKATLDLLQESTKQSKLTSGLQTYTNHKLLKRYITALKHYVSDQNFQRIQLIKIRAKLQEKTYLQKPLLALKNLLVYKVFQQLKIRCQVQKDRRQQSQLASYAVYLSLNRKAFYALRLNAASKFQQHTSYKLKKLFLMRRMLRQLKRVCQEQKRMRGLKMTATVARVLALQRKVFKALSVNQAVKKQQRIMQTFSATLYYKSLCSRVLLSLKIYNMAKKQTRELQQKEVGQVVMESTQEVECQDTARNIKKAVEPVFEQQQLEIEDKNMTLAQGTYTEQLVTPTVVRPNSQLQQVMPRELMNLTSDQIVRQHTDSMSNDFVISQAEMGPISMVNYQRMRNVPQTMLEDRASVSQHSNSNSRGPSALSMFLPMTPPSDSNY